MLTAPQFEVRRASQGRRTDERTSNPGVHPDMGQACPRTGCLTAETAINMLPVVIFSFLQTHIVPVGVDASRSSRYHVLSEPFQRFQRLHAPVGRAGGKHLDQREALAGDLALKPFLMAFLAFMMLGTQSTLTRSQYAVPLRVDSISQTRTGYPAILGSRP